MCEYLYVKYRRDELISLCDQCIILYPEEERYYRYKLLAYLGMNAIKTALEFYHSSLNFFSSKYGTDISQSIQDIYKEILIRMPNLELCIDNLEKNLNSLGDCCQTFYCNFDIFKTIYRLNKDPQGGQKHYLLLLTIRSGEERNAVEMKDIMANLHHILNLGLHKNDVFTRISAAQYSVILTVDEEAGLDASMSYIQESFKEQGGNPDVYLDITKKEIG